MALANVILGASSLYWRALSHVSPTALLGYRILISLVTLGVALAVLKRIKPVFDAAFNGRLLLLHLMAAVLVSANWLTFIWGSVHGHVLETGLGYLIAPAVTIVLGAGVMRERLDPVRVVALVLCLIGIILLIARSHELEWWVYVTIGTTWGIYSFLKKLTTADPFTGLTLETAILAVGVGVAILASTYSLAPGPDADTSDFVLLALCGVVSVTPLWLISFGAKKITLSTAGFLQYVLPTTQLVVALVFYGQQPSGNTLVSYATVWLSLILILVYPLLHTRRAGNTATKPPALAEDRRAGP
ncbi:EamA family transporter [Nonomuraea jiangxiensis]|nr:EamA family transporter [Nonomuraea jiangxiensis]